MIGGRLQQAIAGMMPRKSWAAHLLAGLSIVGTGGAAAQTPASLSEAEICLAANRALALGAPLPRTAARLGAGDTVTIVAIGSSSTTGLWVLSPSATYPEVMRRELARLRPAARIEIINSGRVGETIGGSIARFERDVLAHSPDLVVWQLGTNDVAWGGRADGLKERVVQGVRVLKASGVYVDVILMDLQYAPIVLASSQHAVMQTIIAEVAREERVGLFLRFALTRRSIELSSGALVSWDGLHNSAAGRDCVGRALARAVCGGGR
jgi:acyl-CoA thioesterase I